MTKHLADGYCHTCHSERSEESPVFSDHPKRNDVVNTLARGTFSALKLQSNDKKQADSIVCPTLAAALTRCRDKRL